MPDTPKITLIKKFLYRGVNEEWSNTYHFTGTTPANEAAWRTLANAWWNEERKVILSDTTLVAAYGYNAGSAESDAQIDFVAVAPTNPAGVLSPGSEYKMAGDQAGWIRAYVGHSATGKKVYIRKYFHGGTVSSGNMDNMSGAWKTAALLYANKLIDGTLSGDVRWCSPQGTVGTLPAVSQYVTTRSLKRRGKRPS